MTLLAELEGYPGPEGYSGVPHAEEGSQTSEIAVPLRLRTDIGELAFISSIATFGTAVEVTTSELWIETFFPLDEATGEALRSRAS